MKFVILLFLITTAAHAQVASATLSGTVLDQSSGAIAAAAVVATKPATAIRTSRSDSAVNLESMSCLACSCTAEGSLSQ